jgi:hypothetical protein
MSVQPTNSYERVYSVWVVFWALLIFSLFVAKLTGIINQLWEMKAGQTKQIWQLRKHLKHYRISKKLFLRIQNYAEHVLEVRSYASSPTQMPLIATLSEAMRADFFQEVFTPPLQTHVLFNALVHHSDFVTKLCIQAMGFEEWAAGDTIFARGADAFSTYFLRSGEFVYRHPKNVGDKIPAMTWCGEAVLWTPWKFVGSMEAESVSTTIHIDPTKMCKAVSGSTTCWRRVARYAVVFVFHLNSKSVEELTDLPMNDMSGMAATNMSEGTPEEEPEDVRPAPSPSMLSLQHWMSQGGNRLSSMMRTPSNAKVSPFPKGKDGLELTSIMEHGRSSGCSSD